MKRWLLTLAILLAGTLAYSQTYATLYTFTDGSSPSGQLTLDAQGNLYGTATGGAGAGSVFELMPSGGTWARVTLYTFTGGSDGGQPNPGLVFDAAGNLYGTTSAGGSGRGVVFQLSNGTETVLHTFEGTDGANPRVGLVIDAAGNLYGSTTRGGTYGHGTVFELPKAGGFQTLFNFGIKSIETTVPLTMDAQGNVYGATNTVFKLALAAGKWTYTPLWSFRKPPMGGLTLDANGDVYCIGGFQGNVYELIPASPKWQMKILNNVGFQASSDVVLDAKGIYGATATGGADGYGVLFGLTWNGTAWMYSDLHDFDAGSGSPKGNLVLDGQGDSFGVTVNGEVFRFVP